MFYSLKVKEIVKETEEAVSISFELPSDVASNFDFKPGQFLTLKADIGGEDVRRSYSICSTPKSGELKVAVKQIPNGKFSTYAVQHVKQGDDLEVGLPAGKFTVEVNANNEKNYVFVAAGSGITPVMSMLKTVLQEEPKSRVSLFYGNKSIVQTIFFKELQELAAQYANRFSLKLFFSQQEGDSSLTTGRITADKFIAACDLAGGLTSIDGVYLCGPKSMIDGIKEHVASVAPEKIGDVHFELFTSGANEEESESVIQEAENNEDFDQAKVTANIDGVDYTFLVSKGKDILSSALAAGVDVPYSCQGGVCGSCECTVTEGKVELNQNMVLSDDEVEEGQTLACQAVPKTAEIKLDFDF